jgi:hypothetical protein
MPIHCWTHSIREVPIQLRLVKALKDYGVLDLLMPCDLVAAVRTVGSLRCPGFVTEALIAFLKDPTAIETFGGCAPTGKESWTGNSLEKALHETSSA